MVVVCLSKCPPALRGDLTRWLLEVDTGVYAGNVSARVREHLWERIVENIKEGRATMVYGARNEQRMEFRVHNSEWIPTDFDGMKLMLRPVTGAASSSTGGDGRSGYSSAAAMRNAKRFSTRGKDSGPRSAYAVVDIETTGISPARDTMIEIGAVKVSDGRISAEYQRLIRGEPIPPAVQELTGITDAMLAEDGVDEADALRGLLDFCGELPLVLHNAAFDLNFLRQGCMRCELPPITNKTTDTMALARRTVDDAEDLKLSTLAAYFGIKQSSAHRSVPDCETTMLLYEKLIEK